MFISILVDQLIEIDYRALCFGGDKRLKRPLHENTKKSICFVFPLTGLTSPPKTSGESLLNSKESILPRYSPAYLPNIISSFCGNSPLSKFERTQLEEIKEYFIKRNCSV